MKMTMNEMQIQYAFGCSNRKATIHRLWEIARNLPNPAARKPFARLAIKLYDKSDDWYGGFYYEVLMSMGEYYRIEAEIEEVMNLDDEEDEDGEADQV